LTASTDDCGSCPPDHFHRLLSEPPADQQAAEPEAIERERVASAPELPTIPPSPPRRPTDPNIKGIAPFPMACISYSAPTTIPQRRSPARCRDG
jgi:hypothetical protein